MNTVWKMNPNPGGQRHYEGEARVIEMHIKSVRQNKSHMRNGWVAQIFPLLLNELVLEIPAWYGMISDTCEWEV